MSVSTTCSKRSRAASLTAHRTCRATWVHWLYDTLLKKDLDSGPLPSARRRSPGSPCRSNWPGPPIRKKTTPEERLVLSRLDRRK